VGFGRSGPAVHVRFRQRSLRTVPLVAQ
jgi:hypothetical protein